MDYKKNSNQIPRVMITPPTGQVRIGQSHKSGRRAKVFSIIMSLLLNGAVLLLLMLISISVFKQEVVELVLESGPNESRIDNSKKVFQISKKQKPQPANASNAAPVISSVTFSNDAVFAIEDDGALQDFGLGDGWGKGADFGSGQKGGSIGFFGSRSVAERVVFIVDVSASLSKMQFGMIKQELTKSLDRLAPSVEYQVIFFSGPAWFADDEQSVKNRIHTILHEGKKYIWNTQGGASKYYIESGGELYSSSWIKASQRNIRKTINRVELVNKSFGTDWRHPLKMALNMDPSPDVVYFLTDGVVGNGQQAVDEVIKMNRRGPRAKIFTISMMQPKAEDLLKDLADRSGGDFSVVLENGEVKKTKGKK